jgi:hypothetical protein
MRLNKEEIMDILLGLGLCALFAAIIYSASRVSETYAQEWKFAMAFLVWIAAAAAIALLVCAALYLEGAI